MKDRLPEQEQGTGNGGTSGPTLVFRRAGMDDYSTIRHVQASAIRALGHGLLEGSEIEAAAGAIYSPNYIADLALKSLQVAVLNGDLVATCAWNPSDDRGSAARLSALYVAPLFQGRGIGRKLIGEVEKDAASNGFKRFSATVPVSLVTLFAELGYVTASFGTSRDVIPQTALQVAFLRKPG